MFVQAAGVSRHMAQSVGIAVDHRRKNRSVEGLEANVQRLRSYLSKLVVFPRKNNTRPKAGDAPVAETSAAVQHTGPVEPIQQDRAPVEFRPVGELGSFSAYKTLRQERTNKKMKGKREKRAREAEKEDK